MRRLAVAFLAIAFLAAPHAAGVQPAGKPARLGLLYGASPAFRPDTDPHDGAIAAGLRDQFVLNLKTAKALGVTIPQSLLLRADD